MTARILAIDIERQSGLIDGVWGSKTYNGWINDDRFIEPPRTICLAWKWIDDPDHETEFVAEWDFDLEQDNSSPTPGGGHRKMVEKARELFDEADYIVGFNSKNFDVKYLQADIWVYSIRPPSPHVDIDLMLQFKSKFNTLAKSMKFVLKLKGLEDKMSNERGLWRKLRFSTGEDLRRAQRAMKKYNISDVDRTVDLYYDLQPWLKGVNLNLFRPEGAMAVCPMCGSDDIRLKGTRPAYSRLYQRFVCNACGKWGQFVKSIQSAEVVAA